MLVGRIVIVPVFLIVLSILSTLVFQTITTEASPKFVDIESDLLFSHSMSTSTSKFSTPKCADSKGFIDYDTVTGFFMQDDPSTNASNFDFTTSNFGLINRTYETDKKFDPKGEKSQWERFGAYVKNLNDEADENTDYKVLFIGRHGDGIHNAAETYYGTPAWNCFWSEKDGNGTDTWADAHLTPLGIQQAETASKFWLHEIQTQNIPLPQTYYTSPLYRCLETSKFTFSNLPLPPSQPFDPLIKEFFREGISGHTCDRRSNKTFIHQSFPSYRIEEGFSEEDLLWMAGNAETPTSQDARTTVVLDDVFSTDSSTYISITTHSGEMASLFRVLNHQVFSLKTGAVIPVLVKATKKDGKAPTTTIMPWTTISTCSVAPATSTLPG